MYQTVGIPFGQGENTKFDSKALSAPKLTLLQDCIFTQQNQIRKRNGFDKMTTDVVGGATLSSVTMVRSYKNELICSGISNSTGNRLFSYSDSLNAWIDKGKYLSIAVSKQIVATPGYLAQAETPSFPATLYNASSATNQLQTLYVWDAGTVLGTGNYEVTLSLFDSANVTAFATNVAITSSNAIVGYSKAVLLGSSQLAIFYIATVSGVPYLFCRTITVTESGGVVIGAENSISKCSSDVTQFPYCYDVVTTSSGAFAAVGSHALGQIGFYAINTSGAVTSSALGNSESGSISPISITLDNSGTNAWIYWVSGSSTLNYAVSNATTLAVVLAATAAQTGLSDIIQVTSLVNSSTSQTVYLSSYTLPAGSLTIGVIYPVISQQTNTSAGSTGSVTTLINGFDIYSKPFSIGNRNYMAIVNLSQGLSSGFIIDLADTTAVAKFLQTAAEGLYKSLGNLGGSSYVATAALAIRYPGFLPIAYSSPNLINSVCLAAGSLVELVPVVQTSITNLAAFPNQFISGAQFGVSLISFDFENINAYQSLIQQDTVVLNGGIVEQYDGGYISELGYNVDPDGISVLVNGSTGNIGAGTFVYYVTYSWNDLNGNLHQSAPSNPITVVTTGSSNTVIIGFSGLTLTQKQNVVVQIWRTQNAGQIAHLIYTIPNPNGWSDSFVDSNSDAFIATQPQLYTQGAAILPNIAPPASMVMWTNNNRIWAVDSENPETTIEYCKTASNGTGISFSTGNLEIQIDSLGGAITGGSRMDQETVVLKGSAIGYFIGDGANDAGSGATITTFQFIPSDTGCVNSNSVLLTPDGVVFKSPKGIYCVTRGLQVVYYGPEQEAYNSQTVNSVSFNQNKNQILYLTSSGLSFLYDYFFKQWSVFTNFQGVSSDTFNGLFVYARADGTIFLENTVSFLDNGSTISPLVQFAWMKGGSVIQGFQRMRRLMLLGDFAVVNGGHGVKVSIAYDFVPTFSAPIPYIFTTAGQPYQYRERTPRQKCDSFQLQIQEITTGASGEYIDFTDLGLEVLGKTGLNKLPASRSVG